jgi:hypothetical protein
MGKIKTLACIALFLGLAQCTFREIKHVGQNPDGSILDLEPDFAVLRDQIFTPKCAGCHGTTHQAAGVDLSNYASAMKTAGIVPGNPEASGLYRALASGFMPQDGPRLSAAQLQAVYNWIKSGARATRPVPKEQLSYENPDENENHADRTDHSDRAVEGT